MVRTLELFAGLGGLGLALPRDFEVVAAYDQDEAAADAHALNHGVPVVRRDLASVDGDELASWGAEAWALSPPCQPFTRRGRGRDVDDARCRGFLRVVDLLPRCRPRHVLVENVVGFLGSTMHALLVKALRGLGHEVLEVEACPTETGAPVRRPRQFVIASTEGLRPLPAPQPRRIDLETFLDQRPDPSLDLPADLRARLDRPAPGDGPLGTFTRSYGRALTGAGPLRWKADGPRWYSPEEILRLHEFPAGFRLPAGLSRRQRWRLAGNSVHVGCVRRVAATFPRQEVS